MWRGKLALLIVELWLLLVLFSVPKKECFMNIITVADIKRSGFAVLESALERGPVHLMKRNRPSAVLLRPADYDLLVQQARRNAPTHGNAGLALLLAADADGGGGGLGAPAMQARMAEIGAGWSER
jgi:PHD/YefM family antitoxin component YafN of YafNO toxin-antitoxin module